LRPFLIENISVKGCYYLDDAEGEEVGEWTEEKEKEFQEWINNLQPITLPKLEDQL
jgi:hypothetical protein